MKRQTKAGLIVGGAAALSAAAVYVASNKAIDFAYKRNKKEYELEDDKKEKYMPWINKQSFEELEMITNDGLKLKAKFLRAQENTNKVLIAIHGYHTYNIYEFAYYLKFYHDLGFNVLMPDNRGHGESEGDYVGFGWLDRLDCIEWITKMKYYFNNEDLQIVLFGISMGSATVLMASGEELIDDVKCIISDCGFTSVYDELEHGIEETKMPNFLLKTAVPLSKKRVGYNLKEASAVEQVKKSKTPTLFIHGDQDDFVPTYMAYSLYNACQAEKDLLIVEGAGHAESYKTNPELYQKTVTNFINKYVN
ncbi:MAG: alpha/beta hydrolase [Erysipelotrichaceae bacterium]|nr:alpha/beta hydrolase [Erysipelotrichaceae bacterium]